MEVNGFAHIFLTASNFERSREFYRKHGYEQHALLQDFYADGDSMVVFRKSLNV